MRPCSLPRHCCTTSVCAVTRAIRFASKSTEQIVPLNFLPPRVSTPPRSTVWEAIALHTSRGIPERRGPLTFLTRAGAGMDFGKFTECISDDQAAAIHEAYPRLAFARSIVDDIVEQIRATPERGPMFSIGHTLVSERSTPPYVTQLEHETAASRWGE